MLNFPTGQSQHTFTSCTFSGGGLGWWGPLATFIMVFLSDRRLCRSRSWSFFRCFLDREKWSTDLFFFLIIYIFQYSQFFLLPTQHWRQWIRGERERERACHPISEVESSVLSKQIEEAGGILTEMELDCWEIRKKQRRRRDKSSWDLAKTQPFIITPSLPKSYRWLCVLGYNSCCAIDKADFIYSFACLCVFEENGVTFESVYHSVCMWVKMCTSFARRFWHNYNMILF